MFARTIGANLRTTCASKQQDPIQHMLREERFHGLVGIFHQAQQIRLDEATLSTWPLADDPDYLEG